MLTEITYAAVVVAASLLIHVFGILFLGDRLLRWRKRFDHRGKGNVSLLFITLFLGILALHVLEMSVWACLYSLRGLFNDFETSLYFSMVSYTTIGYGDVVLPQNWRLLGAIEGISGVLLAGVSTAFLFAVINALIQLKFGRRT